jgi:hypothetical protein
LVELELLQTASYLIAALSFAITCTYYIMNLKNTQKSLKIAQETRQIQLLFDYGESIEETYRNIKLHVEMQDATWNDFEDYREKNWYDKNPELFVYRSIKFQKYHVNGLMVRDGLIDVEKFVEYNGDGVVMMWRKYKEVILKIRKAYHLPTWWIGFEYLAEDVDRYRIKMGWGAKTADDFSPDYLAA